MNASYGLLGRSLRHSVSPVIHHYIFEILGLSAHYDLVEVEKSGLHGAIEDLMALNAIGVNVTIPYKTEVIQYLDTLSPEAAAIGAVNTIAFKELTAIGYNTDYYGFGMLLKKYGIRTEGKEAIVLGYGGGAKAVIKFLQDNGIKDIVVAVRSAHSKELDSIPCMYDRINFIDYEKLPLQKDGDLIINCTPVGMYPNIHDVPVSANILRKYHTAVDLIYNPLETLFLSYAGKAGIKAVNGLYMLVGQAVAAHNIWNEAHISQEETDRIYDKVAEYMRNKISP